MEFASHIKPNILRLSTLSDFGLSSNREQLETLCSSEYYHTPEVDIWSLGIVGLEFAHSLPKIRLKWNAHAADYSERHAQHIAKHTSFCRRLFALDRVLCALPAIVNITEYRVYPRTRASESGIIEELLYHNYVL